MTTEDQIEEIVEIGTPQGITFKRQESVAKFYEFFDIYHRMLKEAVEQDLKKPWEKREHNYDSADDRIINVTVIKMRQAVLRNKYGVNYNGSGWQKTCKHFGIKYTGKAIIEYLES